jgi:FAD-dependent urate hydroxylase
MHDLKIVVVGGGIGGLTAGIALTRAGYDVELYERAPEIRPIGAGISLWPNGVKVLHWLGLGRDLAQTAPTLRTLRYLAADGRLLTEIPLEPLTAAAGQRPYPLARTDIQLLLYERLGRHRVTLGAECVAVEESADGVTAVFGDGRRATGDVLVGADGVRSVVRDHVLGRHAPPLYAGNVTWNGLVARDRDLDPGDVFTIVVGDGKRWGMMPVGRDRVYFFFDAPLPAGEIVQRGQWRAELRAHFEGWSGATQTVIDRVDEDAMARQPIHDLEPLEHFVRGRIALLGDAAHAATPTLGQGAAQAMEDGEVLSRCLLTTDLGVEDALARYERQRRDRAHAVARVARARTDLMMGKDRAATDAWYAQLERSGDGDVVDDMVRLVAAGPFG